MAMLVGTGAFLLQRVIPKLRNRGRMLGIGRMSMSWHVDDLIKHLELFDLSFERDVVERMRSQGSIYTSKDFFECLGFKDYQDIDFDPSEGCSIIHDLNQPLPKEYENQFDLVVENGTLEHIFDIKEAIGNLAMAVKVGGLVCHASPLNSFNHGFYNFSLNFFNDFYCANGFEEREFYLMRSSANWIQDQNVLVEPLAYTHEEFYVAPDVNTSAYNVLSIGFVATKKRHYPDTVVPTQAAYDKALRLPSRLNRVQA